MQILRQDELIATWKWFETWLDSLPDDFTEKDTLYESIDKLFEHIDSQEKMISNLDFDLKQVGESFRTLKDESSNSKDRRTRKHAL
jgi:hypothetical protein